MHGRSKLKLTRVAASIVAGSVLFGNGLLGQSADTPQSPTRDRRDDILYADETESIKPLAVKLTRNIIMDQKDIWTSPFHVNRHNAAWWLLFGGAAAALIASDHKIAGDVPTKDTVSVSTSVSRVGAPYTILPVIGGLYIFGALADNPKARETSMLGAEAALDSLIVVEGLKLVAQRSRPMEKEGQFFDGGSSFPSGHSTMVWSVAAVVASEYNKHKIVPVIAYSLASFISVSRITARKHFASDVVIGSGIGWFTGRYVFKSHYDHSIHKRSGLTHALLHPQVAPVMSPVTGSFGVAATWGH
jgi:membrane-associated phospholipid phosphatase